MFQNTGHALYERFQYAKCFACINLFTPPNKLRRIVGLLFPIIDSEKVVFTAVNDLPGIQNQASRKLRCKTQDHELGALLHPECAELMQSRRRFLKHPLLTFSTALAQNPSRMQSQDSYPSENHLKLQSHHNPFTSFISQSRHGVTRVNNFISQ